MPSLVTTPLQYPLINGFRKSFVSLEAVWSLVPPGPIGAIVAATGALNLNMKGYKNIHMERTKTRGDARGTHPDPLGKTRGSNKYKASVELMIEEWLHLQQQIQAIQSDYGNAFFNFSRTYTENGSDTITDIAIGCTMDSTEGTDDQGDDPTMRKMELNPLKILFNQLDDEIPLQPLPQ